MQWRPGLIGMIVLLTGCRHKTLAAPAPAVEGSSVAKPAAPPATKPATRPATTQAAGRTFDGRKLGVRLEYPAGWTPKESKDYDLLLVPEKAAGEREISLDVPDLPPHVPGMIPLGMVKNGYLDDLKKKVGTLQTKEETPTIPGAHARLVTSRWEKGGKSFTEAALVLVHGDHVYILRASSDAAGEKETRAALDAIITSLQWVK